MARGQLPRAYLRIDPNIDAHADPEAVLLLMVWANRQPRRGRFKGLEAVGRVLGPERLEAAKARGDLVQLEDGAWYLEGWDVWQEGDLDVGARMRKLRAKRKGVTGDEEVTAEDVTSTVTPASLPSEASRRRGVEASETEAAAASLSSGSKPEGGLRGEVELDVAWVLSPPTQARGAGLAELEDAGLPLLRMLVDVLARRIAAHPFGGGDPEALLLAASQTGNGAAFSSPDSCTSESWLRVTRDKLRALEAENRNRAASAGVPWRPVQAEDRSPPGADGCTGGEIAFGGSGGGRAW